MLQQLCIICILHQASVGGKYLSKMDYKTDDFISQWKLIIDYEKRIENKMKDENFKNKIYLNQIEKSPDFSTLLLKKNLKKVFKKHKSSDLKKDVDGNMRLTLLRAQMKELLDMSLLIDQALSKMPKEKKGKESTTTNEKNEMKNGDKTIHVTRKKTMDDKSQLIWLRVN